MNPITSRERRTVVADANVLYSNEQRNVLVTLSMERVIRLRWTDAIEAEWVRNLVANNPRVLQANIERTCGLMRRAIPDYATPEYQSHLGSTGQTDPKDRHVAAAAIADRPCWLITWNLADFDAKILSDAGVVVLDPDTFLCEVFDLGPEVVHAAVQRAYSYVRKTDARPSWAEYLDILASRGGKCSLPRFAEKLRSWEIEDVPCDDETETEVDAITDNPPGHGRK